MKVGVSSIVFFISSFNGVFPDTKALFMGEVNTINGKNRKRGKTRKEFEYTPDVKGYLIFLKVPEGYLFSHSFNSPALSAF